MSTRERSTEEYQEVKDGRRSGRRLAPLEEQWNCGRRRLLEQAAGPSQWPQTGGGRCYSDGDEDLDDGGDDEAAAVDDDDDDDCVVMIRM